MTRSDQISALAYRFITVDAETLLKVILGVIGLAQAEGAQVKVRGLGRFCLNGCAPRAGRNPKAGEAVSGPAKYALHVKPGGRMWVEQSVKPENVWLAA